MQIYANHFQYSVDTLYPFKFSITHANNASRPTETVTFGIGSANLGIPASI